MLYANNNKKNAMQSVHQNSWGERFPCTHGHQQQEFQLWFQQQEFGWSFADPAPTFLPAQVSAT